MAKRRGRLDPDEVKRELREAEERTRPDPGFHNPFADAADRLSQVKVKPPSRERRRVEPSVLAEARARHKAAREALAAAVRPKVRPGRAAPERPLPVEKRESLQPPGEPSPSAPDSSSSDEPLPALGPPPPRLL
jgi:hypothetical protein